MLSTTIKKVYMDAILSGEKRIEYKENTPYWQERIYNEGWRGVRLRFSGKFPHIINFLCGQKSYKYNIRKIRCIKTPRGVRRQVKTNYCFAIELGERVS